MEGGEEISGAALLALRPASVAPPRPRSQAVQAESASSGQHIPGYNSPRGRHSARGRGARSSVNSSMPHGQLMGNPGSMTPSFRGRGGHGGPNANGYIVNHGSGRVFGGRLTTTLGGAELQATAEPSTLQPDAPEFTPGQQHQQRSPQKRRGNAVPTTQRAIPGSVPRRRRDSKSSAPDIATRTHDDISNGIYECPICTCDIARSSKVWSCKTCWTVFHLGCIKKWSENEGSTLARQQLQNGDLPPPRQWRCPGCNLPKDDLPSLYVCWCEKETDPRSISGLPPHSCGQTCSKSRILPKKCPHPCELLCHAGPCPPCPHLGPVQSCFCGKKSTSRRCVDTNYDTGWSCGEVCGDVMPCGEHTCQRPCHEGLCGACEVRVDGRCYCGKITKPVICCERGDEKASGKASTDDEGGRAVEQWIGIFDCGGLCDRAFDCGKHLCELQCHPQKLDPPHCPRAPDIVSHCPCGKKPLTQISEIPRRSCSDAIPTCHKECTKTLACGHPCEQVCHSGPCAPCLRTVTISCRCGRMSCLTACHQGTEEPPLCMRVCKTTLNCGRHECGERCCQGERKATERQAAKRKLRPLGTTQRFDDGFEAEHICTRLCGRTLKCGNHPCPELCHKGPCGSCREAIFDEVSCHCGRTVLQPPLPCGTSPPLCRYECERPKSCGHPQIAHNCHGDQESCPKCPFLVGKACMCGKKTLKNQPCWLADARCGEVCGRRLRCGSHFCRKPCHRSGECEDVGKTCQQPCGKAKKSCGHPCEELCHAPASCREDKQCQSKTLVTCECQHLKQEMKCNASKSSEGNTTKVLKCDDECARLERNRKLALALNIDPETHKDDHIPYSTATLQMYQEFPKWAQTQEREFRVFAADDTEKRLRFKPMPARHRTFIHSLAEDFGFDSESMDPEPHRHVFVFKTPRFVASPMKTLADCIRIRNLASLEASASASAAATEPQRRLVARNEPFNAFLLAGPRFALTIDDLRADFAPVFATCPKLAFDISFLPTENIVLRAHPSLPSQNIPPLSLAALLTSLKPLLSAIMIAKHLAASISLCALDPSLNVLRREEEGKGVDGWSKVAAKAAAPRLAKKMVGVGERSAFTVLGRKVREGKKTVEKESVVEDWEEEVRREEEREMGVVDPEGKGDAGGSGDGADGAVASDRAGATVTPDGHDVETAYDGTASANAAANDGAAKAEKVQHEAGDVIN